MTRQDGPRRAPRVRAFLAVMTCLVVIVAAGCLKEPDKKPPIRIGLNIWPGYAHIFLAAQKGFFEKNGVEVVLSLTPEQNASLKVYEEGGVDGVFTTMADVILLNSRRKSTAVVSVVDFSVTGDVIVGRPEFKTLADLKGQRLSFEGVNTFSNIFVLKALEAAGVKEFDVTFENVPAHQVLSRLEDGSIAAGHTWEPTKSQALKKGYTVLAAAKDVPGVIVDVLAFDTEVIRQRPQDIKAIVKALLEARDYSATHREESLGIMAKALGMNPEEMEQGLLGIHQPDLNGNVEAMKVTDGLGSLYTSWQTALRFYFERGQLIEIPDFKNAVDPSFVSGLAAAETRERRS